jgi:vacuolar-type H+-ATPase subunit H
VSADEEPPANGGSNVEALKRVKAVEREAETRVGLLRTEGGAALKRLADEADAAVQKARQEAAALREAALAESRARAESDASRLLEEGRLAAQAIAAKAGQGVAAKRAQVLKIVLGPFREK